MTLDPKLRLAYEEIRTIAFGSVTASYATVGTPLNHPARLVKFYNGLNVDVLISLDGSTDNDVIPSGGFLILDIGANKEGTSKLFLAKETQFYVKRAGGSNPTTGTFYLTVIYGS